VYQGKIVMPNPASSGTGYLDVSAWLQTFGEAKGWAYMDKLHANIGQYTHSGSKPCKLAASGEFPIGISFEYPAIQLKRKGAPLDIVLPAEGLGWEIEATAVIKGTPHLEAARKLADFSASREAMDLYKANFAVLAQPGIAERLPELPADYEQRLIRNDFNWASENRDNILAEWRKRYDGSKARGVERASPGHRKFKESPCLSTTATCWSSAGVFSAWPMPGPVPSAASKSRCSSVATPPWGPRSATSAKRWSAARRRASCLTWHARQTVCGRRWGRPPACICTSKARCCSLGRKPRRRCSKRS
jgi:hypothetical protein